MKKQFMKSALLVVAVMGAMTFSSCKENENGVENPELNGPKTDIAIGIKMVNNPGSKLKAVMTPDDVNMGDNIQSIAKVVIVPMVGSNAQHPIDLGDITSGASMTKYRVASILQSVDGFRVYGNLPTTLTVDTAKNFTTAGKLTLAKTTLPDDSYSEDVYAPHALYYYKEALAGNKDLQVGESQTAGDWGTFNGYTALNQGSSIGDNNRVKIQKVTYGVGAFAAAVLVDLPDTCKTKKIFTEEGQDAVSWNDMSEDQQKLFTIEGMIIDGQTKTFNDDFTRNATDGRVQVYAEATDKVWKESMGAIKFESNNTVKNANIYTVVAPENAATISVNFMFKNGSKYSLTLNDGNEVAPNDYFYMVAQLDRQNSQDIFAAATSTLINARVKDWGRATTEPVQSTEVEIGIEISTDWQQGIAYDEDL